MTTQRSPRIPKDQAALAAQRFTRWMDRHGIKAPAVATQLGTVHPARLYEFTSRHQINQATLSAIAGLMKRSVASLLTPVRLRRTRRRRWRVGWGVPVFLTTDHLALVMSALDRVHANTTAGKKPLAGLRSKAEGIGKFLVRSLARRFTSSAAFQHAVIRQPVPTPRTSVVPNQHLAFTVSLGPGPVARRRRVTVSAT